MRIFSTNSSAFLLYWTILIHWVQPCMDDDDTTRKLLSTNTSTAANFPSLPFSLSSQTEFFQSLSNSIYPTSHDKATSASSKNKMERHKSTVFEDLRLVPDIDHFPFLYGVASGDPLENSILIWTRVYPLININCTNHSESKNIGDEFFIDWRIWERDDAFQSFDNPFQMGVKMTSLDRDYTVMIDVQDLTPGTSYHYQFALSPNSTTNYDHCFPNLKKSMLGSTKTSPDSSSSSKSSLQIAILSCTSIWSGYFNMYRHLSQQSSIDIVLHVGDYIYPDIDEDEVYRVPYGLCNSIPWFQDRNPGGTPDMNLRDDSRLSYLVDLIHSLPCPQIPLNNSETSLRINDKNYNSDTLQRYRWIHQLYSFDPDFRQARANHPFVVLMDNHDLDVQSDDATEGSRKASLEWIPQRVRFENLSSNSSQSHCNTTSCEKYTKVNTLRNFQYGNGFVDMILLDTWSHESNKSQSNGILGEDQHLWLQSVLNQSFLKNTTWRIIASCKAFMPFILNRFTSPLNPMNSPPNYVGVNSDVWMGHTNSIKRLFDQLDETQTDQNNLWVSGDMHYCYNSDVVRFVYENTSHVLNYNPMDNYENNKSLNYYKRYGGEILPCSGTRGNVDELFGSALPNISLWFFENILKPPSFLWTYILSPILDRLILWCNRHYRFFDGSNHGYGIATFSDMHVKTTIYFFNILKITDEFSTSSTMTMKKGSNQWS